ncbi:MAG TPA: hypothetical protein VGQ83_23545, partial [Polyangia bacterium]
AALRLAPDEPHALYQLARIHGDFLEQPAQGVQYLKRYKATGAKLAPDEKVASLLRNFEALAERAARGQPKPAPDGKRPGAPIAPASARAPAPASGGPK